MRQVHDTIRDRWLEKRGIVTLRISARAVFREINSVVDGIVGFAIDTGRLPPPERKF
jgi:very-short-patch-repair endonuclease